MPTVMLVRHGRTGANAAGTLAGRTPGVGLDDTGRTQAAALADRVAGLTLRRVVVSPLQRCQETAAAVIGQRDLAPVTEDGLVECDYGDWTGRSISELAKEPMWGTVQQHPSAAVFPGGEGLADVSTRAVAAVRRHDRAVAETDGEQSLWVAVSHGDVIKAVLADAFGMHLDAFQRIVVDPCSVSVVRYTPHRAFVLRSNDTGGDLGGLEPPPPGSGDDAASSSDAVPGGGAGPVGPPA